MSPNKVNQNMNGHGIRIKLLWFQWNLTSEQSSMEMLQWLESLKLPRGQARWQPDAEALGAPHAADTYMKIDSA